MVMRAADRERGGFGQAQKFPTPTNLELLLTALDHLPEDEARAVAEHCALTCQEMARRGLWDHLAGGFHRYCVDGAWTIPHFERDSGRSEALSVRGRKPAEHRSR